MAPLLIGLLIIGGGTSLAAKTALPGSPLYGVKTGFNENLQKSLSFSDAAKAHWDAVLENRRLDEAGKLQAKGQLTAANEATIKAHLDSEAMDYSSRIKAMQASGKDASVALTINTDLSAQLAAHRQTLDSSASANSQSADLSSDLSAHLGDVQNDAAGLQAAVSLGGSANANSNSNGSVDLSPNGSASATGTSANGGTTASGAINLGL